MSSSAAAADADPADAEAAVADADPADAEVADADPADAEAAVADADQSPDEIARSSAARMWAADTASRELGMVLLEVRSGYARLRMIITASMLQGHGTGHGGYVFLLADSAFAFACNSYGPTTVAAHCDISFLAPIREGDELEAEAVERTRYGRNGIYDVTVRRLPHREVVAEFRGKSRTIGA